MNLDELLKDPKVLAKIKEALKTISKGDKTKPNAQTLSIPTTYKKWILPQTTYITQCSLCGTVYKVIHEVKVTSKTRPEPLPNQNDLIPFCTECEHLLPGDFLVTKLFNMYKKVINDNKK